MTEYDSSPEALQQHQRTQNRIAHWVDDTEHCAPQFRSPFAPRSDVQDNEFYHSRSRSGSRQHTHPPPGRHGPSPLHGYADERESDPDSLVAPNDSISQVDVAAPASRRPHARRLRSHSSSPTRHSHKSSSHRSGRAYVGGTGSPPLPPPQYSDGYVHTHGVSYAAHGPGQFQPMQYPAPPPIPVQYAQPQPRGYPTAYVIHPHDHTIHPIFPGQTDPYKYQCPTVMVQAEQHQRTQAESQSEPFAEQLAE
ncbi:hypothetical protein FB45DRAFT_1064696 [Roridomyces roridus]|uniref:Uncharacterized protein n=1 Tax=Roridomyces roridus TaxID=1738132 RepID=A0AAD7FDW9_9AGAR|nr:hypothetical protein FB45DRAFT_1064696 [Roridomyces roridus]